MEKEVKSPLESEDMNSNYIPTEVFLDWALVFHWATKRHFQLAITGRETKRHRRTEIVLRRLSLRKKLRTVRYGKKLVYALPRKTKDFDEFEGGLKIYHGLACTECLVRFYRSRMEGEIISERFFRGCGSVPEWGIRYPDGKLLLLEFSSRSNFLYTELMNGKINAYMRNLEKIEEQFRAKAVVLFVLDVHRDSVKRFVGSLDGRSARSAALRAGGDRFPFNPFFFVDYETFLKIPIGDQLKSPIYFWTDGKEYPLTK